MGAYIGQPVKRVEDKRFITGKGRYTDDIVLPNTAYACFVRSPHAHAHIKGFDVAEARACEGVVAIYSGEDLAAAGNPGVPTGWLITSRDGNPMKEPAHPLLASKKVRFAGDAVAVVFAESLTLARDAAELVAVDYEVLDAVTDPAAATASSAPTVHEEAPDNICFDWELGDQAATDATLAGAAHVTRLEFTNQRLVPNAIEPRAAIAEYDSARDRYTLYTTSQNPHLTRLLLTAFTLGLPEHKVRVIAPDVGGGFGSKIHHYIEEAVLIWASSRMNRPLKWTADRSESFLTDAHGRDHKTVAEMGFDADHKLMGLRVKTYAGLGAYLSTFAPCVPTWLHGTLLQGLYTTSAIYVNVVATFTNTTPVDAYRGAGRPEATFLLERLMDQSAHELGVDPVELRLKNFIPPFDGVDQPGYQTQVALQYDSGDYPTVLKRALATLGYEDLRKKQLEGRKKGHYLGIGISTYIEACGIAPSAVVGSLGARAGLYESAIVRVQPTGKVSVFTGSHSHGQGHETTFAQIVADRFGISLDDVDVIHGDTETVPFGMGTYGSRSLAVGGSAIVKSIEKILEKGAKIAAHTLECAEEDLAYAEGKWTVKGTDRSMGFAEMALSAYVPHNYPEALEPGLDFSSFYDPVNFTYPFGAHIALVEVDGETGKVKLTRLVACDDVGNLINPMIVEGQIHGGLAQGIGQALFEGAVYDNSGQLINGSYMDYTMPRADDLPSFETDHTITPCPHNPLGVKGVGEAGTIGSTPAVVNAVIDALWHLGVRHIEMPLTPQRVWKAIQEAGK